ncbi:MAG: SGNH/GDSL hydrolase family protein [Victivallales bacterium]|nr:SGNH/GDSL hydrolase family protein [Victivallales bacterium]
MIREPIEWSQFYWYATDQPELPRVLLIGDSIVVGSHGAVAERLSGKATIGMMATSKIVGDPGFLLDLELALSDYLPQVIVFNNGLHGRDYDDAFYRDGLVVALERLQAKCPHAKLLWRSSTPVTAEGDPTKPDPVVNALVERRNRIATEVMAERNIPVLDVYPLLLNHPEYRVPDGYHYKAEGYNCIADFLAPRIIEVLK